MFVERDSHPWYRGVDSRKARIVPGPPVRALRRVLVSAFPFLGVLKPHGSFCVARALIFGFANSDLGASWAQNTACL